MCRWGGSSDPVLDLISLRSWAVYNKCLKENLQLALLVDSLILSSLKLLKGLEGCRLNLFNGKCLNLEWWNSEVGCIGDGVFAQKEWVFLCTCT